jgi:serine/threonine-protein kinase
MEYLSGQSLQVAIGEGGLPYRTVIDMAGQLMRGLAAVHAVGVVHRNPTPANIIVSTDGTLLGLSPLLVASRPGWVLKS